MKGLACGGRKFLLWSVVLFVGSGCASQYAVQQAHKTTQKLQQASQVLQGEVMKIAATATGFDQQLSQTEQRLEENWEDWDRLQKQSEKLYSELRTSQHRFLAFRKKRVPGPYPLHVVQKGDTLWALSGKYLTDPRRWPEIWKLNEYIANPHRIYPGDPVLLPGVPGIEPEYEELFSVSLPERARGGEKIAEQAASPVSTPSPSSLSVYSPLVAGGYISPQPLSALGTILDSQEGKIALTSFDTVFIKLAPEVHPAPGETYMVFRQEQIVSHPVTGRNLGYLISVLGDLRIQKVEGTTAIAGIGAALDVISPGDHIQKIPSPPSFPPLSPSVSAQKLEGYVVQNRRTETNISSYDIVYLDVGYRQGVMPGDFFTVIRTQALGVTSLYERTTQPQERVQVPIGEIQIIAAQEDTSTGLVVSSEEDFTKGTKVVYSYSPAR